jgi:predicted small lipoprotein YifL
MQRIVIPILLVLLLSGCGRKGPLVPPEALLPAPVADLRVAQQGEGFRVSWSLPVKRGGVGAHRELAGFRLFKREVLPPDEDCEACADAYRLVKSVDLDYLQDVRQSGDRLFVADADVSAGTTYQYKVAVLNKDGTVSSDSNKARRKKVVPPAAPLLRAEFASTGIILDWEGVVSPTGGRVIGYNIYRWREGALSALSPQNGAPEQRPGYEDARLEPGIRYVYTVRTVAEVDGETVESVSSNEVHGALAEPE